MSKQEDHQKKKKKKKKRRGMDIEGYQVEGISIGGQETCIIIPSLHLAFDIGRCPQLAISQDFLFISHSHLDHIGGLPMYVAARGLLRMKPPTIVVPSCVKETVEELLEMLRERIGSELNCNIVGLDVGEEISVRNDIKVKAFRTYHTIRSQGYLVYAVKHDLKQEYLGLSATEIENLKVLGVQITDTITTPEIAFTGDTTSDFITDEANADVLRAKILIVESTFLDNTITTQHAREYGHTHLSEIINSADKFQNKAILLIHFSARYTVDEIQEAVCKLPPPLPGRVFALTEGILSAQKRGMVIEGYQVEGISIGGQETCIILPYLHLAFDIGRCPQRAISQDFLFISHFDMDHIGGLPMYVATRGLYRMKPPTVVVPSYVKETVERLLDMNRKLDGSELNCNIVCLDVGGEIAVGRNNKVKAFRTYHTIQSQGYLVYAVKQKLKREYLGLSGTEIKNLKTSGVEITDTITTPEIAFTGDTKSDFITDEANADVLRAKLLIVESTFLDNTITLQHAREYGHTHLSEIIDSADKFQNKAIFLIHFSDRYTVEEIQEAVCSLPPPLSGRVFALTAGIQSGQDQLEDS